MDGAARLRVPGYGSVKHDDDGGGGVVVLVVAMMMMMIFIVCVWPSRSITKSQKENQHSKQ
jgi:hypothetical protein